MMIFILQNQLINKKIQIKENINYNKINKYHKINQNKNKK